MGVPWPSPRFTRIFCDSTGPCAEQLIDCDIISSNNVVTDNLTGLVWSEDANLGGLKTWENTITYTNDLTVCGSVDWRLPNSKELFSLIDRSRSGPALPVPNPFINFQFDVNDAYWSATSFVETSAELLIAPQAWTLDMLLGGLIPRLKTETSFAWPVRGGQPIILTVERLGNGNGKVTAPGFACLERKCTENYTSYEVVNLTAKALGNSAFTGWGGACTGTNSTCTFTVTSDITVTATFTPKLKISVTPKSLKFKNLKQNVESTPLQVIITNVGVEDLDLSTPAVIAEDPTTVFKITSNDCPAALPSPDCCTITVTATSPDYDQKTAELQIVSNDPKKPTTIVKLKAKAKPPKIAKKPVKSQLRQSCSPRVFRQDTHHYE